MTTAAPVDRILERLDGVRRSGDGWVARCPGHDDRHASLSVGRGADGRVLLNCKAGCDFDRVVYGMNLEPRDLFARERSNGHAEHRNGTGILPVRVVKETPYEIRDVAGELVARHIRLDLADGGKRVTWQRPDGASGLGGIKTAHLPLFRSEDLAELEDGAAVIVCEGEKAADAVRAAGIPAAGTVTGAAGTPSLDVLRTVARFDVVLWPDNDKPGREHMQRIADRLAELGCVPRIVEWTDAPLHGDAADFKGSADELRALVEAVEPIAAPTGAGDGAEVLDDVHAFLGRFVAYPSAHAHNAHTLWIAHAHLMGAWESTPRLAALSPEPGSGKTRLLEVTELLVPRPVEAVNVTPAYLFRKVGDEGGAPTILYDEIDTVFGPRAKENEELRGLLNAGHRRGAVAGRCVVKGKRVETEEIPAYCAVALAGLGGLPDTILTRSIVIRMRRRAPGEEVEPFRRRVYEGEGHALRDRLAGWGKAVEAAVADAWPAMPDGIVDRDGDLWEPLLAVADAAGGDWPERARCSAVALVAESKAGTPSLGVRLLTDLRAIFGDREAMGTEDILKALNGLEEAPWAEITSGKPLNARVLARRLRQYQISSSNIREGGRVLKGYAAKDLADAWARYVVPSSQQESATSATDEASPPGEGVAAGDDQESATSATAAGGDCGEGTPDEPETVSSATPVVADESISRCIRNGCGEPCAEGDLIYCAAHRAEAEAVE